MTTMHDDLARSGLTAAIMQAVELPPNAFSATSQAYRIPYFMPDGTEHPRMHRVRLLDPPPGAPKYTQPSSEEIVKAGGTAEEATLPYLNPTILGGQTWMDVAHDTAPKTLLLVEGEKKAAAVGLRLKRYAVGIGGCWMAVRRDDHGVFRLHPWIAALIHPGDKVEVVLDSDILTNPDVRRAAGTLRRALMRVGVAPSFVMLPKGSGKRPVGVDDWLMLVPAGNESAEFDALPRESDPRCDLFYEDVDSLWEYLGLVVGKKGPLPIELNIHAVITKHERYAGLFWYDALKGFAYENSTGTPRSIADSWLAGELRWMMGHAGLLGFSRLKVFDAFLDASQESLRRNPLLEEVKAAVWDGVPRREAMFIRAFGTPDTAYARAVGRNWLVGAVARLADPGCQFDNMLILEGAQGIRKSSALSILSGDYYVALKGDITSKDFLLAAHSGWIADLIELSSMRRADVDHIKGEITTRTDTLRAPYERTTVHRPRSFVFVGTTNSNEYLRDSTGNRRFWPIECNACATDPDTGEKIVDTQWLADNRTQLLAEAYAAYKNGHIYWDMPALETAAIQASRMEDEPLIDTLWGVVGTPSIWRQIVYLGATYHFTATSELLHALNVPIKDYPSMAPRVSRAMARLGGWKRHNYISKTKTITLNGGAPTLQTRGYIHPISGTPARAGVTNLPSSSNKKLAP